MSNFEKVVTKALKEADEARGEGISIGKEQGIIQVVKEMIKNKMSDEDIIKYTHISKKELENLKLQMA